MTRLRPDFIGATAGSSARREGPHPAEADDKSVPPRINAGFPAKADEILLMKSHPWHDSYTARARREGYPARSVYKLAEIQKSYGILRRGGAVLDLGCVPGSWLLYASKTVGEEGRVVGVDIEALSIPLPANARFVQRDILSVNASFFAVVTGPFDAVLSDMAPLSTGSKFVDAHRSFELSQTALDIASRVLRKKGAFVCKVFHGPEFKSFSDQAKLLFRKVVHVKPKSTRKASKEIYVVGLGKKQGREQYLTH